MVGLWRTCTCMCVCVQAGRMFVLRQSPDRRVTVRGDASPTLPHAPNLTVRRSHAPSPTPPPPFPPPPSSVTQDEVIQMRPEPLARMTRAKNSQTPPEPRNTLHSQPTRTGSDVICCLIGGSPRAACCCRRWLTGGMRLLLICSPREEGPPCPIPRLPFMLPVCN